MKSGHIEEYESGKAWRVVLKVNGKIYDHCLVSTREKAEAIVLGWIK